MTLGSFGRAELGYDQPEQRPRLRSEVGKKLGTNRESEDLVSNFMATQGSDDALLRNSKDLSTKYHARRQTVFTPPEQQCVDDARANPEDKDDDDMYFVPQDGELSCSVASNV